MIYDKEMNMHKYIIHLRWNWSYVKTYESYVFSDFLSYKVWLELASKNGYSFKSPFSDQNRILTL